MMHKVSPSSIAQSGPLALAQRRIFSQAFKQQVVDSLNSKSTTIAAVSAQYDLRPSVLYKWLHRYSPPHFHQGTRMVIEHESDSLAADALRKRVAELERLVGQKQVQLEYLEQIIAQASASYGVDLKKNSGTKPSNGSVSTAKTAPTP
jgi:transposase-like protein